MECQYSLNLFWFYFLQGYWLWELGTLKMCEREGWKGIVVLQMWNSLLFWSAPMRWHVIYFLVFQYQAFMSIERKIISLSNQVSGKYGYLPPDVIAWTKLVHTLKLWLHISDQHRSSCIPLTFVALASQAQFRCNATMSIKKLTVKVEHSVNGDGAFDGQNGSRSQNVHRWRNVKLMVRWTVTVTLRVNVPAHRVQTLLPVICVSSPTPSLPWYGALTVLGDHGDKDYFVN